MGIPDQTASRTSRSPSSRRYVPHHMATSQRYNSRLGSRLLCAGWNESNCWYDLCLVKIVLVVLSNIWEVSLPVYLIPVIGARHQLLLLVASYHCQPHIAVSRISLSAVPRSSMLSAVSGSPMCDITTEIFPSV